MTELRETVAATMAAAEGHAYSNDCPMVQRAFRQYADAAIEAIFAALQSDEAVEAMYESLPLYSIDRGDLRDALQAGVSALTPSPATREEAGQ